jgi:hypothetical protein
MDHADIQATMIANWQVEAYIDGQFINVPRGLPTRTLSARRARSTCTLPVYTLPASGTQVATVDLVLNGYLRTRFFTGFTAERSASLTSFTRDANLVDALDLDKAVPSAITWSSRAWTDAVADILTAGGIPAESIDSVFDPGSAYVLGPVYPVKILTSENLGQVLQELLDFAGGAAYVAPSGSIRIVDGSGVPMSTSEVVYAYAADLAGGEFGILDAGLTIEGDESRVSSFTATGPKTTTGAIPDGTYTAAGITGKAESTQYRFAQSDTTCAAIASRELSRRARDRTNLWFTAPLNPVLLPGDTVLVRCPALGLVTNTPAYVAEVATSAEASMRVAITIGPSLVEGYSTSIAPPVVDFAMRVEQQQITIAGAPVTGYLVQCKDQSRDKAGRKIVGRTWTATGAGATPESLSWTLADPEPTPKPDRYVEAIFTFTDLTGATIKLHVASSSGEEAEITRKPLAQQVEVLTRTVSVAAAEGWFVLIKSGWQEFTAAGACTAVPAYNASGVLWAGFSSGALYTSADALQTAPTLKTTLAGTIGCIFVSETDNQHVLVGHGAKVSLTRDGGTTWAVLHDFASEGSVLDCQSSPANVNELRVLVGTKEYASFNGGTTWTALVTGAAGSVARAIASAPWGHAVAYSGTIAPADSIKFEEGYGLFWLDVAEGDRPITGLGAITPLINAQGFVAAEDGRLVRDGTLPALILQADAGGSNVYRFLWDGVQFVATLLPMTTAAGPGKLINQADAYPIDSTSATQIGYGGLATPISTKFEILRPTAGVSPGGVQHYVNGTWTLKGGGGLPSGMYWVAAIASPFNPDQWLAWGDTVAVPSLRYASGGRLVCADGATNPLWYTADAGATWVAVPLTDGSDTGGERGRIFVAWSPTVGGAWAAVLDPGTSLVVGKVWRGTGATSACVYNAGGVVGVACFGQDNDLVLPGGALYYLPSSGALRTAYSGSTSAPLNHWGLTAIPLSRRVAYCHSSGSSLILLDDYRANAPQRQISGMRGRVLASTADGSIWLVDDIGAAGAKQLTDPFGTATETIVPIPATEAAAFIRTDTQTRTRLAVVLADTTDVCCFDGTAWTRIVGPGGTVGGVAEIIVRSS